MPVVTPEAQSPPHPATPPPDAASLGRGPRAPASPAWERLVDVFAAPGALFRDLAATPAAWPAVGAAAGVEFARVLVAYTPARTPAALTISALLQLVVVFVPMALLAGALRLVLVAQRDASYARLLAVVAHAAIPFHLLGFLVVAGTTLAGLDPPPGMGHHAANLGWLVDPRTDPVGSHLLRALDVGRAWQLALVVLGVRAIAPRVGTRGAAIAVAAVWGGYLLATTAARLYSV